MVCGQHGENCNLPDHGTRLYPHYEQSSLRKSKMLRRRDNFATQTHFSVRLKSEWANKVVLPIRRACIHEKPFEVHCAHTFEQLRIRAT